MRPLLVFPLILAVAVAPLAVYRIVEMSPNIATGWLSDLYSISKARVIMLAGLWAFFALLFHWRQVPKAVLLIAGSFMALTVLSAVRSRYPQVVLFGAPYLSEGTFVLLAYGLLMMLASVVLRSDRDWDFLVGTLGFSTVILLGLAICEAWGRPYLDWAPDWMTGMEIGDEIRRLGTPKIAATFGNSNHLGTYGALVGPLFMVLIYRNRWYWVPTVAAIAVVVMSHSRGGIVGLAAGTVVACLCGRRLHERRD